MDKSNNHADSVRLFPNLEPKKGMGSSGKLRRGPGKKGKPMFPNVLTAKPVRTFIPPHMLPGGESTAHIFMGFNATNVHLDGNFVPHLTELVDWSTAKAAKGGGGRIGSPGRMSPERRAGSPTGGIRDLDLDLDIDMDLEGNKSKRPNSRSRGKAVVHHASIPTPVTDSNTVIRSYSSLMDQFSLHNLLVWNGRVQTNTPEFQSYRRSHESVWESVEKIITGLEGIITKIGLKLVVINGQKVSELAKKHALAISNGENGNLVIDESTLIACIMSSDHEQHQDKVDAFAQRPVVDDEASQASISIQARARGVLDRRRVALLRVQTAAAIRIQKEMRRYIQCYIYLPRRQVVQLRNYEIKWAKNAVKLQDRWRVNVGSTIPLSPGSVASGLTAGLNAVAPTPSSSSSRLVIAMCSIAAPEITRLQLDIFQVLQNALVPYLHLLADPGVHLALIIPFHISTFELSYHEKFVGLMGISLTPNRLHLLTPEMVSSLPPHFTLSHIAWYSSKLLRKLKGMLRRFSSGVLVSNQACWAERRLCYFLDIPLLGCEPTKATRLSMLSATRLAFEDSDINVPVGSRNIYNEEDLLIALTRLIASNLDVDAWVIRLNSDKGIEYSVRFDVGRFSEVKKIRSSLRSNPGIATAKNQLQLRMQILRFLKDNNILSKFALISDTELYPSWTVFLHFLSSVGGVLDAIPPGTSSALTSIDVGGFIHPDGELTVWPGMELIASEKHQEQAVIYPQQTVSTAAISGASLAMLGKLYEKHSVFGYVTLRFAVFNDPYDKEQRLWGMSMVLGATPRHAGIGVLQALCRANMSQSDTLVPIPFPTGASAAAAAGGGSSMSVTSTSINGTIPERCFVHVPLALHSPLRETRDDLFMQLCGISGISFDRTAKTGTVFFLSESVASGTVNVMTIAPSTGKALEIMQEALSFITRVFSKETHKSKSSSTAYNSIQSITLATKKAAKRHGEEK